MPEKQVIYFVWPNQHTLLISICLCHSGQENSPTPSTASIVGFSVVLSFLIIALCIVVFLCVCFGKCRMPCKPLQSAHETDIRASERDTHRPRPNLVPQPSPKHSRVRPSSLENTNSVQQPVREQRYTSLPPSNSLSTTLQPSTASHPLFRGGTVQQNPQQFIEAVNTLPASSSSNKVVHLSQINAESFKKITSNDKEYSQQHVLNARSASSHNRRGLEQAKSTSTGLTPSRTADSRPLEIPESGLPYQPQKSPFTPRGYSASRPSHSFPMRPAAVGPSHPIPYLSSARPQVVVAPAAREESPLQDTTDEISTSTQDQGHYAFPTQVEQQQQQQQQDENTDRELSTAKTPPPSYSTVV